MLSSVIHCFDTLFATNAGVKKRYLLFLELLECDRICHRNLARLEELFYQKEIVDIQEIRIYYKDLSDNVERMMQQLALLAPGKYRNLSAYYKKIDFYARFALAPQPPPPDTAYLQLLSLATDESMVGGKAYHLSQLQNDFPVVQGFVFTTALFQQIITTSDVFSGVDQSLAVASYPLFIKSLFSDELRRRLEFEIDAALENLNLAPTTLFAVRSSAVCEDSHSSFAGIYDTILGVSRGDLLAAYCRVLASKYSPEALYYRRAHGLADSATRMAVLVQPMLTPNFSGVLRVGADEDSLSYVQGLGDEMMMGQVQSHYCALTGDGQPILPAAFKQFFSKLHGYGIEIAQRYNCAQDVEWVWDGALHILQARQSEIAKACEAVLPDISGHELLLESGLSASPGCASGPLFFWHPGDSLAKIPVGSILCVSRISLQLLPYFPKIAAIICRTGSVADHFASLAREFSLPLLVQVGAAYAALPAGEMATLDSEGRKLYRGEMDGFLHVQRKQSMPENSPVYSAFRLAMEFVSPLALRDPLAQEFSPESCRTLHDIIRFCHEKAIQAIFASNPESFLKKPSSCRLRSPLPLTIRVVDLADCCGGEAEVELTALDAPLLHGLHRGLAHPTVEWGDRSHFDWKSYDDIALAGGIACKGDSVTYCLVSQNYLNMNMRFGYHFALLDAFACAEGEKNYILLRFAGGGGGDHGQSLRLQLLRRILVRLGFLCGFQQNVLEARIYGGDEVENCQLVEMVGALLGATKLIDMMLVDDSDLGRLEAAFFAGDYNFARIIQESSCTQ